MIGSVLYDPATGRCSTGGEEATAPWRERADALLWIDLLTCRRRSKRH